MQIAMAGIFSMPFLDQMCHRWEVFDRHNDICFLPNGVPTVLFFNVRIEKLQHPQRNIRYV